MSIAPNFLIKHIPVYGDLILAPMDGYSDLPFRSVCRELGSALSYTEFINPRDVLSKRHPLLPRRLAYLEEERPVVYQIFDSEPERLLKAAQILQEQQPDIIDINMGCSVPKISGRGAGAGLLREPQKVAQIFSMLTRNLDVPVTAKIRLGWDDEQRNYLEIARVVEENGGALLAVHARTRCQGFRGQADWEAIAEIKQAVSIPVVANGDVRTVADIERIKQTHRLRGSHDRPGGGWQPVDFLPAGPPASAVRAGAEHDAAPPGKNAGLLWGRAGLAALPQARQSLPDAAGVGARSPPALADHRAACRISRSIGYSSDITHHFL